MCQALNHQLHWNPSKISMTQAAHNNDTKKKNPQKTLRFGVCQEYQEMKTRQRGFSDAMCAVTRAQLQRLSSITLLSLSPAHICGDVTRIQTQKPMSLQQAFFVAGSTRNLKARCHESWRHLSDSKTEPIYIIYALNPIRVQLSVQIRLYHHGVKQCCKAY